MEKWKHNYIDNLDLSKIEWLKLSSGELEAFYNSNYIDRDLWQYVSNKDNTAFHTPIGLRYLTFDTCDKYNYLIGIVENNIGKNTIVAAMVYIDEYHMFVNQREPFTYISTMEVNSYFWNMGIFKELCKATLQIIKNQHVLVTRESEMGEKCHVLANFRKILLESGFDKEIIVDDSSSSTINRLSQLAREKEKVKIKV
ncbi:MAG: hypothetical protein IJK66_06055 [Bacilli bacterium]|nr:hypothetical protein [Bacilli bacterium]